MTEPSNIYRLPARDEGDAIITSLAIADLTMRAEAIILTARTVARTAALKAALDRAHHEITRARCIAQSELTGVQS